MAAPAGFPAASRNTPFQGPAATGRTTTARKSNPKRSHLRAETEETMGTAGKYNPRSALLTDSSAQSVAENAETQSFILAGDSYRRSLAFLFGRSRSAESLQAIAQTPLQWRRSIRIKRHQIPQRLAAILAQPRQRPMPRLAVAIAINFRSVESLQRSSLGSGFYLSPQTIRLCELVWSHSHPCRRPCSVPRLLLAHAPSSQ